MDDEHKLLRDTERADRARALLENDVFKDAFAELEKAYIKRWRESSPLDQAGREKLYLAINVLGKVKEHFGIVVSNGKLARADLDMRQKRAA